MTDQPPPPSGPIPPPPPSAPPPPGGSPPYGFGPSSGTSPAGGGDPRPERSKRGVIIAVAAVVALAAGAGGAYFLTNDDGESVSERTDPQESDPDETDPTTETTEPDETDPTTDTTVPPQTTGTTAPPATTAAVTSTTERPATTVRTTTTTLPTVPDGAIDLGFGAYLPIAAGWEVISAPDEVVTLSNGDANISVQVLQRTPGERPADLAQEYIDTFDADFATVSYSPSFLSATFSNGTVPARSYGLYYRTLDEGESLAGGVYVYQRSDGLSLIYDIWAPSESSQAFYADDQFFELRDSYLDAPVSGEDAVVLQDADPFLVTSSHPFVPIEGLIGLHPPQGFTATEFGAGYAVFTNGVVDVTSNNFSAPSADEALGSAQATLLESYPDIVFNADKEFFPATDGGWTQTNITYNGTYPDGRPIAGGVAVFWNPTTQEVYSWVRHFQPTSDGVEPFEAETTFMYYALFDSISAV